MKISFETSLDAIYLALSALALAEAISLMGYGHREE